jgi:hypothetical protein
MPSLRKTLTVDLTPEEVEIFVSNMDHLIQCFQMEPDVVKIFRKVYKEAKALQPHDEALDRARAVNALRSTVSDYMERSRKWTDPEMKKSARDDASDIAYIADLVEAREDAHAKSKTADLDTAVRDEIPKEAYRFVGLRSLR